MLTWNHEDVIKGLFSRHTSYSTYRHEITQQANAPLCINAIHTTYRNIKAADIIHEECNSNNCHLKQTSAWTCSAGQEEGPKPVSQCTLPFCKKHTPGYLMGFWFQCNCWASSPKHHAETLDFPKVVKWVKHGAKCPFIFCLTHPFCSDNSIPPQAQAFLGTCRPHLQYEPWWGGRETIHGWRVRVEVGVTWAPKLTGLPWTSQKLKLAPLIYIIGTVNTDISHARFLPWAKLSNSQAYKHIHTNSWGWVIKTTGFFGLETNK